MTAIQIPENAIGRVGMVAALKRVNEKDIGKLVAVREAAGIVTSLVGSNKPVFAWLVISLGEPIDINGTPSRSIYVADNSLMPMGEMTLAQVETISRADAQSDFDAALAEVKEFMDDHHIKPEDFDSLLNEAAAYSSINNALEVVAIPTALREIGFMPSAESDEALLWTVIHEGMELKFVAGNQWIDRWVIVGTGNSKRQAVWDERTLPNEAPRGKIVKTVLDIWRTAFSQAPIPDCMYLGKIYEQHQADLQSLNLGLPNLHVDPIVFRTILKWLRTRHTQDKSEQITFSYSDKLLRLDVEGVAYGCPCHGYWVDDCKVLLADLTNVSVNVAHSHHIQIARTADHILVNGSPIGIKA
jgi:hypothetical protein